MDNRIIVSLATAAATAVLVGGATILTGAKLKTNYLQNIKACSEFNNLKLTDVQLHSKHFENVKRFVDAGGKGTLVAKKIDACGNLAFIYYEHGEKVDVSKNSIVSKDWGAVRKYIDLCSKKSSKVKDENSNIMSSVSKTKKVQKSKNDSILDSKDGENQNEKSNEDSAGSVLIEEEDDDADSGSVVIHEPPSGASCIKFEFFRTDAHPVADGTMSDAVKGALDSFNMTEEDLNDVLHTFWVTKERYRKKSVYNVVSKSYAFENFYPLGLFENFLLTDNEDDMKRIFVSENHWGIWKHRVEKTLGEGSEPNPIAACYFWVARLNGAEGLAKELNVSKETVIAKVRRFVELFYRLVGVEEKINTKLVEITSPTHVPSLSDVW